MVWQCWGFTAGMVAELLVAGDLPSILFGAMISSDVLFQALITTGAIIGLWAVQEELRRAIGLPPGGNSDAPPALEPALIDRASQIIRNDPAAAIIMTLRCFAWLAIVPEHADLNAFLGTNAGANSYFAATGNVAARIQETLRSPLLTALVALQFMMMVFVWVGVARAVAGLGHKTAFERSMILLPFLLAIAFLGLASGAESVARFRTPVAPMLAILAASGWCGQFRIAKEGEVLGAAAAQSGWSV